MVFAEEVFGGSVPKNHGLQQDGGRLGQSGLVGQLGGGLKGDFRGVHRVVASIVQHGLQVDHRVTRQGAVDTGLPQPPWG